MTALRGIASGWGYDIRGADVLDAYATVMAAANAAGVDETVVKADVRALIAASLGGGGEFVGRMLERQLADENKNGCTSAPSHNCAPAETDAGQHYPEHCSRATGLETEELVLPNPK